MADSAVIYGGHGFSSKGDKGRYVLPASFRKLVTESSRGENLLHVTQHESLNCLIGFGTSCRDDLTRKIEQDYQDSLLLRQPFDRAARNMIFGNIVEITYDNSGRLIIPAYLREIVEIDEHIYFHAAGDSFMMWAPHILQQQQGPQWAVAKSACKSFMNSAGKAGK